MDEPLPDPQNTSFDPALVAVPAALEPQNVPASSGTGGGQGVLRGAKLIQEIRDSAESLSRQTTPRGDLKLISRSLRELIDALAMFGPYRRRMKVTVFGSARTRPDEPAYQQAVRLGEAMARENWLVITGAASGIMEAGHRGAGREHAMGVNIMLPFEQSANEVIQGDPKLVNMRYFFTRKLMFVKECQAVVLLPGGFGTLDEGFEVLTLLQTGKRDLLPVVLLDEPGGTYWEAFHQFVLSGLLDRGLISAEDLSLYRTTDSVEDTVGEILQFYRNFHSQRYVREELVFRLKQPLAAAQLEELQSEFGDILTGGAFRTGSPLAAERDEADLALLPRLIFRFNRRNHGRLRELINHLNRLPDAR